MRTSTLLATGLFALSAIAGGTNTTQLIKNYCLQSVYFTYTDGTGHVFTTMELRSGEAYISLIIGRGNSYAITLSPDYYGSNKLVLGTTVDAVNKLWWSVGYGGADPLGGRIWNVTSSGPEPCGVVTQPGPQVPNCDAQGITLTLNLC